MDVFLTCSAFLEAATGLALTAAPTVVVRLLFGEEISGASISLARVTGFALLALAAACCPRHVTAGSSGAALRALLIYNTLVTIYLAFVGMGGHWVGPLLWPVVALHGVLTTWCVARLRRRPPQLTQKMEHPGK